MRSQEYLSPLAGASSDSRISTTTGEVVQVSSTLAVTVLAVWIGRYLIEKQAMADFTATTARTHGGQLRRFAAQVQRPPDEIDRNDITEYLTALGGKPSTQAYRLVVIKGFFGWCVDTGLLAKSPAAGIKSPRLPESPPRFLESAEVGGLLLLGALTTRDKLIVELAVQVGLRRREVWALDVGDINRADRVIAVKGKGHRGEVDRYVPLTESTHGALRAYLTEWPTFEGALIRNYKGGRLSRTNISTVVSEAMMRAGVKQAAGDGKSMHALRHTCFQHLIDNGAEIRQVQALAGHASVTTTENYLRRQIATDVLRTLTEGRSYGAAG